MHNLFDWTKPLRTQDGTQTVIVVGDLKTTLRAVCMKDANGTLGLYSYDNNGKFNGYQHIPTYPKHLVLNVTRRWRWLCTGNLNSAHGVHLSGSFYKDQTEADTYDITLLVKCESLFQDTPIS